MKIPKATVTAVLYKSKTLASGEHPVMIRVCYNSKRRYKSTGLSCPAKWWNAAKQEVRERHPLAPNMNAIIGSELTALKNKVLDFERQGVPYSVQRIFEASVRKPPSRKTLYDLFEERIAYFRDTLQKHNTATGYQTLLHIVERFSQHRTVELFDVDGAWLGEFEEYLHAHYADTSIKRFFSALKALMNYACQNGLLDANPFDRFRLSRRLDVRTAKRALETDEFDSLIRYYLDTYYYKTRKRPDPRTMKRRCWRAPCHGCRGEERQASYDAEQFALSMFICQESNVIFFNGNLSLQIRYQCCSTCKFHLRLLIRGFGSESAFKTKLCQPYTFFTGIQCLTDNSQFIIQSYQFKVCLGHFCHQAHFQCPLRLYRT